MKYIVPTVLLGSAVAASLLTLLKLRSRREANWHDGLPVYKLKNSLGMEVHVSVLGAAILKLIVPDKKGAKADVVLGYQTVEEYEVGQS